MTEDFLPHEPWGVHGSAGVWGDPQAELDERRCFFRGDECCEYHLGWRRPASMKSFLLRLVAPWKLANATIEELERDKDLLKEKYAEVHGLNVQLKAQVDRLVSLQEASTPSVYFRHQ